MNIYQVMIISLAACLCACAKPSAAAPTLSASPAHLQMIRGSHGWGVALSWESHAVWKQEHPIALELVDSSGNAKWIERHYDSVQLIDQNIHCIASITSPNGTLFKFEDIYRLPKESRVFTMQRRVIIDHPSPKDTAFSTKFTLAHADPAELESFDILAPGVWYGTNDSVPRYAIGGDKSDDYFYFREDRLAAPFLMAMDRKSGIALSVAHRNPNPQTFKGEDFLPRLVDERMQFGSFGLEKIKGESESTAAGFLFPGTEGEKTYIAGGSASKRWAYRSHPVKSGIAHSYSLILKLDRFADYPTAVRDTWRCFYGVYKPRTVFADLPKVYADGVDLLAKYARDVNGAPGFPFSIAMDGKAGDYNYQMGFVGSQIPGAYHLFRYGISSGKPDYEHMGEEIIDFWVNESYDGRTGPDDLPHTWYQPSLPASAGPRPHWGQMKTERFWRDEPLNGRVFTRTLSEGHLAVLRAWLFAKAHGIRHDDWLQWARRYGNWLVLHQNPDGSYYRRYEVTGKLIAAEDGTTHPIPFLVELYKATGDRPYLTAALSAGNFAWKNTHLPARYVGGTPDNPNVPDKEAVQIALNAFLKLYEATKDRKWLLAAERAADFMETWVYVWDVPMPVGDSDKVIFDRIDTSGLSLVASGHSYADYADASSAYDFWRLYELTGDAHYRDFSLILFHNTKQLSDTDGSKGYAHPGLQVEGIGLSVLRGAGARVWLPWVTLAHIEPIAQAQDAGDLGSISAPAKTRR